MRRRGLSIAMIPALAWLVAGQPAGSSEGATARLVRALEAHDLSGLGDALRAGANPNARVGGVPALNKASMYRDPRFAKALLDAGADPNVSSRGSTPLMLAARDGWLQTVRLLLARGARLESRDMRGRSALLHATAWGRSEVVKLLLDRGANPNVHQTTGATPLMWAAAHGDARVVGMLLKRGADARARDMDGRTAVEWAKRGGEDAGHEACAELVQSAARQLRQPTKTRGRPSGPRAGQRLGVERR